MRRKYGLELAEDRRVLLKKYWTFEGMMRGKVKLEENYSIKTTWVVLEYGRV